MRLKPDPSLSRSKTLGLRFDLLLVNMSQTSKDDQKELGRDLSNLSEVTRISHPSPSKKKEASLLSRNYIYAHIREGNLIVWRYGLSSRGAANVTFQQRSSNHTKAASFPVTASKGGTAAF